MKDECYPENVAKICTYLLIMALNQMEQNIISRMRIFKRQKVK